MFLHIRNLLTDCVFDFFSLLYVSLHRRADINVNLHKMREEEFEKVANYYTLAA
jgi:hypothetical protein